MIRRITCEWLLFPIFIICFVIFHIMVYLWSDRSSCENQNITKDFKNFDNVTGTSSGIFIVPNIVHFIRFGKKEMIFMEAVCVLAALKNQRPKKLFIHTDRVEQGGKYWDIVTQHPLARGVLEVRFLRQPDSVFGHELSSKWKPWHAADVARLELLMAEGGIFLDGDSYIVRNLDHFRRFEMTLGWMVDGGLSNQVIIAHKNARFLAEWYNNYKDYNSSLWFYNAGDQPTQIIRNKPYLIHRMRRLMAEYRDWHLGMVYYLKRSKAWTKHYVIHLMINWIQLVSSNWVMKGGSWTAILARDFNEKSILDYDANIQDMVLAVYPFSPSHTTDSNLLQSRNTTSLEIHKES